MALMLTSVVGLGISWCSEKNNTIALTQNLFVGEVATKSLLLIRALE